LTNGFWPNRASHQRNKRRSKEKPLVYPDAGFPADSEYLCPSYNGKALAVTSSFLLLLPNSSITGDAFEMGATTAVWYSLLYGDMCTYIYIYMYIYWLWRQSRLHIIYPWVATLLMGQKEPAILYICNCFSFTIYIYNRRYR